jgi:hypothetical protein
MLTKPVVLFVIMIWLSIFLAFYMLFFTLGAAAWMIDSCVRGVKRVAIRAPKRSRRMDD